MTGFLYIRLPKSLSLPSPQRFAPEQAAVLWEHLSESHQETLWSWGPSGGDICILRGGRGEVLSLSGYLAEVENGPSIRKTSEAAKFLLENVAQGVSPEALSKLLPRLYGSFAMFYRRPDAKQTLCASDRVASRPLWFFQEGDRLAISTHPSAIAAAFGLREFDRPAMASLLLYGGPVEPRRSLYKGVSQVGAGTVVEILGAGKQSVHQWYRFVHRPDTRLSRADWIELASERLLAAASRILALHENPVVFFSGGTDSRLAAAALKAAGGNPLLLTLGDSANNEVRVARQAARALGLRHEVMLRDRLWYLRGLPRAVFESAGSFVWTHAHFSQAVASTVETHPAASFMLGDFCEAFSKLCCSVEAASRGPWTPDAFARGFDLLPLPLYRPSNRALSFSLLSPAFREDAEGLLEADIARRYEELRPGISDPVALSDRFLRWDHAGTIATFFMFVDLRSAGADRNLMFDRDVHQLLEMLPSKLRDGANFGAALIRRLAPRAAWVPSSNSLLPLCFPQAAHRASKACKPWFGRVRRWWFNNPYTTTGSWPSRHVLYVNEPGWRGYIDRLMRDLDRVDGKVFNHDALRRSWQELAAGRKERAADLEKVILLVELSRMLEEGVGAYLKRSALDRPVDEKAAAPASRAAHAERAASPA